MSLDQRTQPVDRVYEEFEPPSDWEHDEASDTLILMLPGFQKEQLKVQVTSNRVLRVGGERQISENKWRRFRKEFSIPPHSNTSGISAKFEAGMLYVRLSKVIINKPQNQNANNAPTPPPPPPPPKQEAPKPPQQPTTEETQNAQTSEQQKPRVEEKAAESKTHEEAAKPRVESKKPSVEDKIGESKNDEKAEAQQTPSPLFKEHKVDEDSQKKEKGKAETDNAKERTDEKMHGNGTSLDGLAKSEVKNKMDKRSLTIEALSRQSQEYMNALSGLMEEVKKQRKLVNSLVLIFLVLLFGLYVMNVVKSFFGGPKSQ